MSEKLKRRKLMVKPPSKASFSDMKKPVPKLRIKIFGIVQRHYADLGIGPSNRSSQELPLNERILLFLFLNGLTIVLHFVFIFEVANGFMEYVNCISATAASTIIFVCFSAIVSKRTLLFKNIDNLENLIEISEPTIYCCFVKRIQSLELMCFRMQESAIKKILFDNQSTGRTIE